MSLPSVGEPLRLADGSLVYPSGKIVEPGQRDRQLVEVPTHREAQAIVLKTRRALADLPDVPNKMNAINVVLTYEMFGLSPEEIAIATNLSLGQVNRIREDEAFTKMKQHVIENVLKAESDDIRALFQAKARDAADNLFDLAETGRQDVRLRASEQILDRAGHRPADVVHHRHMLEGGLRIEIVSKDNDPAPVIDMRIPQ